MKTTNAKARAIQTPAALENAKPERTNKRTSAQKIKKVAPPVQQSQLDVRGKVSDDDVPDIEYMPPKPKGGCDCELGGIVLTGCRASRFS